MPIHVSLEGTKIILGWNHGSWKDVPHPSGLNQKRRIKTFLSSSMDINHIRTPLLSASKKVLGCGVPEHTPKYPVKNRQHCVGIVN